MRNKTISLLTIAMLFILCATLWAEDAKSISEVFTKGKTKADVGLNFRSTREDRDDGKEDEGHLGWFYTELGYETAPLHGLKVGVSVLGVAETWSADLYKDEFSEDGVFFTDGDVKHLYELKNLYMNLDLPNTRSELLIGRKKVKKVALMDGDIHEGLQFTVNDIPRTKLYLGLITGWQDDLSASWDLDGAENFTRAADDTVDRDGNAAGDQIYTCIADVNAVNKQLAVTPFAIHHPDYLTTYGALAEITMPVNADVTVGLDGGWAEYAEQTDVLTDEDAQTWKIHSSVNVRNFYIGAGFYRVSDSPNGLMQSTGADKTVGNYHWEPIKVEGVGLYGGGKGGDPDERTTWVDAGFSMGKFNLDVVYGVSSFYNVKHDVNQRSTELDVIASYKFTSALSGSLGLLKQDFNDDAEKDRTFVMGGVKYSLF